MLPVIRSLDDYYQLLYDIFTGRINVKDVTGLHAELGLKPETLARELAKAIWGKRRPVIYPFEVKVVPRYPFSKVPMVEWSRLREVESSDYRIQFLKAYSSQMGTLINAGFLLEYFTLIDIDKLDPSIEKLADVKTRRGYHIIFYHPGHKALRFTTGGHPSTKLAIQCRDARIEIMSGPWYLGSYPLQSRYIEVLDGRVYVRRYQLLSRRATIAFESSDLTPLETSVGDVEESVKELLRELGCEGYARVFKAEAVPEDQLRTPTSVKDSRPHGSRFNEAALPLLGTMSYEEFKAFLEKHRAQLPVCVRRAFLEAPDEGERYFFLRLAVAILPRFVYINDVELEKIAREFAERYGFRRVNLYYWRYFSGKLEVNGREVVSASVLGAPSDAFEWFSQVGYCKSCPYTSRCRRNTRSVSRFLYELLEAEEH